MCKHSVTFYCLLCNCPEKKIKLPELIEIESVSSTNYNFSHLQVQKEKLLRHLIVLVYMIIKGDVILKALINISALSEQQLFAG